MKISLNKKRLIDGSETIDLEITNYEEIIQLIVNLLDECNRKFTEVNTQPPILELPKHIFKWNFSKAAIEKLASPDFENNILNVYPDEGNKPTIGVGHLLTKSELSSGKIKIKGEFVKYSNGITKQQSFDLLLQDLQIYEKCVNDHVKVELTQSQYDALVMLCFNIGESAFEGSTLLNLLNDSNYDQVPIQMRRWNKVTKDDVLVVSPGLINRREKEIKIWMNDYA